MDPADEYTHPQSVADAQRFPHPDAPPPSAADLVWKLLRFQFKLFLDSLRDLLLSPLSVGAVVLGLLDGRERPDHYLAKLMRLGQRSDRWINLFGEFDHLQTADALVEPLERAARERYAEHRQRGRRAPDDSAQ